MTQPISNKRARETEYLPQPPSKKVVLEAKESPQKLSTPVHHFIKDILKGKLKDLKKLKNKPEHTLAPDSAEKSFRAIQRNFPHLNKVQRQLDFDKENELEENGTAFIVRKDEIGATVDGKTRFFGVHKTESKEGPKKRAYPTSGDGVQTFSGLDVLNRVNAYKKSNPSFSSSSFEQFIAEAKKV